MTDETTQLPERLEPMQTTQQLIEEAIQEFDELLKPLFLIGGGYFEHHSGQDNTNEVEAIKDFIRTKLSTIASKSVEAEYEKLAKKFTVGRIPGEYKYIVFVDGNYDNDDQIYISIRTIQKMFEALSQKEQS